MIYFHRINDSLPGRVLIFQISPRPSGRVAVVLRRTESRRAAGDNQ